MTGREWTIPCWDAMGRPREAHVRETDDGEVVIAFPAGETATFTPSGITALREVLRLAADDLPTEQPEPGDG